MQPAAAHSRLKNSIIGKTVFFELTSKIGMFYAKVFEIYGGIVYNSGKGTFQRGGVL